MERETVISTISLSGMLPKVFAGEAIPRSDVWNARLEFRRGSFYLVEAESGAGKSSMCSYIYGARDDYDGSLSFEFTSEGNSRNADARSLSISDWQRLRRNNLAYLPQELSLFPELSAMQNVMLKNSLTGWKSAGEIEAWMEKLGIIDRKDFPVGKMSVGQQQRVAIIRALCQPFDFLLLDEPVSHLDETNNRTAAAIIMEEARSQNAAIISTSVGNPLLLSDPIPLSL